MSEKGKPKFTLQGLLHRQRRLELKADVIIEGEVVEDHVVGWVLVRGGKDPEYLVDSSQYVSEYQDMVAEKGKEITAEELRLAADRVNCAAVACAIVDWDEEFFGCKYSTAVAIKKLGKKSNVLIFNQIAVYIQQASDFLPLASQQQKSG